MPAFVLSLSLLSAGCTATGSRAGGVASYVDPLSGRQVVVATAAVPEVRTMMPATTEPAATTGPDTGTEMTATAAATATDGSRLLSLADTDYVDVEVMDRELARHDAERFFMLPDGTGVSQRVLAGDIGADGEVRAPASALPPIVPAAAVWRRCEPAPVVSLSRQGTDEHLVLRFPAIVGGRQHAGYRIGIPRGVRSLQLWSVVQKGAAVPPVLAVLDAAGGLFAVAYTVPTESQPETPFRYGRVGFSVPLPDEVPEGGALAVLDAARLPALPAGCRPPDGTPQPVPAAAGTVTIDFIP